MRVCVCECLARSCGPLVAPLQHITRNCGRQSNDDFYSGVPREPNLVFGRRVRRAVKGLLPKNITLHYIGTKYT